MDDTKTINIEPNWIGMRNWIKHVAATDAVTAKKINDALPDREKVSDTELIVAILPK